MAYSPNVQYEAYKRLDCALSAAFFFFSFLNFFTWFCYIEKCFLFYFVFFSFLFLYKTPPTEAGSCGRSESGRTLSSSVEALAGRLEISVSCWVLISPLYPPCSLSSSDGPGFLAVGSQEGTHTQTHSHIHTQRQIKKPAAPLGTPLLKTCGRGFLQLQPIHWVPHWPAVFQPGTSQNPECTGLPQSPASAACPYQSLEQPLAT